MSLFIDVHDLPGPVSMEEAVKAHAADLQVQPEFGVHYLRYWVDERHGKIFALVDAPDAVAAHAVHRMAHGLVPGAIFPVREGVTAGLAAGRGVVCEGQGIVCIGGGDVCSTPFTHHYSPA